MKYLYLPNEYSQQRQMQKKAWVYPVIMAMEATHMRNLGHTVHWDNAQEDKYDEIITQPQGIDFLSLPIPDRKFTNAFDRRYQVYGNYKFHPATHMMAASGCWHGKCSFCVENTRKYQVRPMWDVLDEVSACSQMGFREIFDDSATFPTGGWMYEFCEFMIRAKRKITLGCNMRINGDVDYEQMKSAGFRMLLYGVESANQYTLDRIKKGIKADDIIPTIRKAAEAGLEPHIAVIFGYPWENDEDEDNTLRLVQYLLRKGWAKTAQGSIYDVKGEHPVDRGNVNRIYEAGFSMEFWKNKLKDIRRWEDFTYLIKGIRKGIVHD